MNTPAVSVNLCVWKPDPRFFPQAVESILNQTFTDFELIIVEDPSEIDGQSMISHLLHDPRLRYVRNEKRTGLIAQRNAALKLSRADWVAILDADDVAHPERLAAQTSFVHSNPEIDIVGSWLQVIDQNGHTIGFRKYPITHAEIGSAIRRFNPIAQPAVFFRRALAVKHGGYQGEPYAEDYDLWCRMFLGGAKFANVPLPLILYRMHGTASKMRSLRHVLRQTIAIKRRYFSDRLNYRDRMRLLAERILLFMPPALVYSAFRLISLRKRLTFPPV